MSLFFPRIVPAYLPHALPVPFLSPSPSDLIQSTLPCITLLSLILQRKQKAKKERQRLRELERKKKQELEDFLRKQNEEVQAETVRGEERARDRERKERMEGRKGGWKNETEGERAFR